MANGDIKILTEGPFGDPGAEVFQVASGGTPPAINPGEPVGYALGQQYAAALATSKPVAGTDFLAGISESKSSETASLDGIVRVRKLIPGTIYLIKPKVATTWNTQAKYNALVGARVTFDLTSGAYTINSTDGATNGLVIENLDMTKYLGLVAFSIRTACAYYN